MRRMSKRISGGIESKKMQANYESQNSNMESLLNLGFIADETSQMAEMSPVNSQSLSIISESLQLSSIPKLQPSQSGWLSDIEQNPLFFESSNEQSQEEVPRGKRPRNKTYWSCLEPDDATIQKINKGVKKLKLDESSMNSMSYMALQNVPPKNSESEDFINTLQSIDKRYDLEFFRMEQDSCDQK